MKYLDIVKIWLSLLSEHQKEIDNDTDNLLEAYFEEHGQTNEFDAIEVSKLLKLAYCIGFKNALNKKLL